MFFSLIHYMGSLKRDLVRTGGTGWKCLLMEKKSGVSVYTIDDGMGRPLEVWHWNIGPGNDGGGMENGVR
jgi:hypothetical protein